MSYRPLGFVRGTELKSNRIRSLSPDKSPMLARVIGIIRRPPVTFRAVVAEPRWAGLLLLLFSVNFGVNAVFLTTPVGRQALVDQWERTALAFGQKVDAARYAEFQDVSRHGVAYAAVIQLVRGPVAAVALAALLYGAFTVLTGEKRAFGQVMAVVVHSTVILTLHAIVAVPSHYVQESVASPTTLVQLFPVTNASSPVARLLGAIDLFVVWWLVVLALGLGILYGRRTWRIAALLTGVYAGVALALAAAMTILGGTA